MIDINQVKRGAIVECTDYTLGVVEQVDGTKQVLIVRPARADYLITIPRSLIHELAPGRVCLNQTLEAVEEMLLDDGVRRPGGAKIERFAADPGPTTSEVLGMPAGEVATYPPTG